METNRNTKNKPHSTWENRADFEKNGRELAYYMQEAAYYSQYSDMMM